MASQAEVPADALGRRVSCGEERATVRYVGPVPPTEGLWLGLEWDDSSRGKHGGSHDGVRYFTCRDATGGSFVRPAKVNFGRDLVSAVLEAYDPQPCGSDELILEWLPSRGRSLEKQERILLSRSDVNGPGADGELRRIVPNVRWLDVARSLLSSWEDVSGICLQLEHLEGLHLGYTRLSPPSQPSALAPSFARLRTLSLIGCDLSWPQILHGAPMWPQLEALDVEDNRITELQRPEGVLQTLRSLNLSGNHLVQETLNSIAMLPRLEELNVSNTGLSSICFPDAAAGCETAMFPALRVLYLDDNNLTQWSAVNELAKLRGLLQVSLLRNRLASADGNPRTAEQLLIAKLGRLTSLNRVQILHEDRRGAELDYLKMFGEEWLKAGGRSQTDHAFAREHPRYLALVDKYGAPDEGELKKPKPFALKNDLIRITFVFPDAADRKPIRKDLPASMLVSKLKGLLLRQLKDPADELQLSYTTCKTGDVEFDIDSDFKELQFYSIKDGDQVLVRWT